MFAFDSLKRQPFISDVQVKPNFLIGILSVALKLHDRIKLVRIDRFTRVEKWDGD